MPKFYVESQDGPRLTIDKETAEDAAKSLLYANPDLVYEALKTNSAMFIFVNEIGFGSEYRTDAMFDIIELVYKMGPDKNKP